MTICQEGRDLRYGGSLGSGELEAGVRRAEEFRGPGPRKTGGGRNGCVVASRLPLFRVLGWIALGRIAFGRINDTG